MVSIIVAMDKNGLIGKNNSLPWRLSADLQYFKKITLNKPIIMGRKTWDSLPGILPNRQHIVISRSPETITHQEVVATDTLNKAIDFAKKSSDEIIIIGGASIIEQALAIADKLYITEIHESFEGDCWFPDYDKTLWQEISREQHKADDKNRYDYDFVLYTKK